MYSYYRLMMGLTALTLRGLKGSVMVRLHIWTAHNICTQYLHTIFETIFETIFAHNIWDYICTQYLRLYLNCTQFVQLSMWSLPSASPSASSPSLSTHSSSTALGRWTNAFYLYSSPTLFWYYSRTFLLRVVNKSCQWTQTRLVT